MHNDIIKSWNSTFLFYLFAKWKVMRLKLCILLSNKTLWFSDQTKPYKIGIVLFSMVYHSSLANDRDHLALLTASMDISIHFKHNLFIISSKFNSEQKIPITLVTGV